MDDSTYIKNLIVMATIWSVGAFSLYLLSCLNKYYEGNIYLTYYLDGAAGIIATIIGLPLYRCLQIRLSFIFSFSLATFLSIIYTLF